MPAADKVDEGWVSLTDIAISENSMLAGYPLAVNHILKMPYHTLQGVQVWTQAMDNNLRASDMVTTSLVPLSAVVFLLHTLQLLLLPNNMQQQHSGFVL